MLSAYSLQRQYKWLIPLMSLLIIGSFLWLYYPVMLIKGMQLQKTLHTELSNLVYDARDNPLDSGFILIAIGFLYGVLHAAGPGHGKVLITTYLVTHPTKVKVSLMLTSLSAFLQALVAVALVSGLLSLLNASMRQVSQHAETLIKASFVAIILFGVYLIINSLFNYYVTVYRNKGSEHLHNSTCGHCLVQHMEVGKEKHNQPHSLRDYFALIISVGIRPCSGAIMLLLFANMAGTYWLGIVGAFAMALGTAITTSSIALLTLFARKQVKKLIKGNHLDKISGLGSFLLKLAAGSILILLGCIMLQARTPMVSPLLLTCNGSMFGYLHAGFV